MNATTTPVLKATIPYDASAALVFGQQAQRMLTGAQEYVIDSDELLTMAGEDLQKIKTLQKQVEDTRKTITDPLFRAKQAVDALFKGPAEFLEQAEKVLKGSMLVYTREQERKAAAARAEAERQARIERERLAEIQRRQEAEARAAEERARKAREEAAAAEKAGDAAAAEAARQVVEQQAQVAEAAQANADATAQEAAVTTVTPIFSGPARVSGISGRVTYAAQVDDLLALVRAVAEGKAPVEAISANTTFLGQQARAFKKAGPLYPGVTVVAERGLSARAA
jgi:membrane protein involved in colicin uptake